MELDLVQETGVVENRFLFVMTVVGYCDPTCKEECNSMWVLRSILVHSDHRYVILWVLICCRINSEGRYGSRVLVAVSFCLDEVYFN